MGTSPITPTETTAAPEPINLTLGDGSVVKGATLREAFDHLREMKENTSRWAKEQQDKAEQLAAENEKLRQEEDERQRTIQEAATPQNTGFDREQYHALLNEDPIAAQNYVDQVRFGVTDPVSAFHAMREEAWINVQANV